MRNDVDKYWNIYSQEYSFEEYLSIYRYRKLIEIMQKYNHERILDIGGGMNPLFHEINGFNKYYMIEPGQKACDDAIIKSSGDERVKVINGYFEDCHNLLIGEKIDFIFSVGVLHETSTPEKFVKCIKNLSNPETVIFINVPNAESFHRILALESGLISKLDQFTERNLLLGQKSVYSMEKLINLLNKSIDGCTILEKGTFFIKPFTHNQMMQIISNKIIRDEVMDGLYKMSDWAPNIGSEMFVVFKINK